MHTKPFRVLNLAESGTDHNLDGLVGAGFCALFLPWGRYRGMGEMGNRNRDVGPGGLHFHKSVRDTPSAPRLAETVRRCGRQGHRRQERAPVVTSDERLRSILEMLETC